MDRSGLGTLYIILAAMLVAAPAAGQVLGPLDRTVDDALDGRLPDVGERLGRELERQRNARGDLLDDLPVDDTVGEAMQSADDLVAAGITLAGNVAQTATATVAPVFEPGIDPDGNRIEKNVLVLLLDDRELAQVQAAGLTVLSERPLPGLGLTMVKVGYTDGYELARSALELGRTLPGASIDFNHVYDFQQTDRRGSAAVANDGPARRANVANGLRIGLVDSAVKADHPVLRGQRIVGRDFVVHDAGRPTGHGTAIASLLADAAGPESEILSASVFFQLAGHAPGASTESLLAALDWLAREDVDAVNMSLAGPGNDLLERALDALVASEGPTVVAAVGNNGPSGEPMYPGAYPTVIGVTAVDRDEKIFRYANRGEHVDFAALGVNVKVANVGGGWRIASGTSMASPRIAAVVATLKALQAARGEALVELMRAESKDLGRRGFDPVFGHGLITAPPAILSSADY